MFLVETHCVLPCIMAPMTEEPGVTRAIFVTVAKIQTNNSGGKPMMRQTWAIRGVKTIIRIRLWINCVIIPKTMMMVIMKKTGLIWVMIGMMLFNTAEIMPASSCSNALATGKEAASIKMRFQLMPCWQQSLTSARAFFSPSLTKFSMIRQRQAPPTMPIFFSPDWSSCLLCFIHQLIKRRCISIS